MNAKPPVFPKTIRRAVPKDFAAIVTLEENCFEPYRRASHASLRRSITSKHQSVWVIDKPGGGLAALLVLWHFPHRVRIYDVATHKDLRGHGLGRTLLDHSEKLARAAGAEWMTLEAEEADPDLVGWYLHHGYKIVDRLKNFYHKGCHAVRMRKQLAGQ